MLAFNNIIVPTKNLKTVPDFCVGGGEFCSTNSTPLEKKKLPPPPKKTQLCPLPYSNNQMAQKSCCMVHVYMFYM